MTTHKSALRVGLGGPVKVAVAGAGGNGSHMVAKLARLDHAMKKLGKGALDVTLFDPDRVSESNVGRQGFYPSEVGQYKSVALIQRLNLGWGLRWNAAPMLYTGQVAQSELGAGTYSSYDLLLTCVDSGRARREIWQGVQAGSYGIAPRYWLDVGNEKDTGQVWIGQFPGLGSSKGGRLLTIVERYPAQFDGSIPETDTPSCSLAEALGKQRLFVNDHVTDWAIVLLEDLLLQGAIGCQGYWVSIADGMVLPQAFVAATKKDERNTERLFPSGREYGRIEPAPALAA